MQLSEQASRMHDFLLVKYACIKVRHCYMDRLEVNAKSKTANVHYEAVLLKRSFDSFRQSVEKSKKIKESEKKFSITREQHTIKGALRAWRDETNRKIDRNYLLSIGLSRELDARFTKRRLLIRWRNNARLR